MDKRHACAYPLPCFAAVKHGATSRKLEAGHSGHDTYTSKGGLVFTVSLRIGQTLILLASDWLGSYAKQRPPAHLSGCAWAERGPHEIPGD